MVVATKRDFNRSMVTKKWLFFITSLGITFLLIPSLFLFFDPILIVVRYYLRLGNGTILQNIMASKLEGPRIYVSLFNITNADKFMSDKDQKLKVKEIGPFVYQEYRLNRDLVVDSELGIMSYTPHIWAEFIREESIGDPKDLYLTMPSIPMMTSADMMSKYPFFLRNVYNMLAASIHSKAIVNITAHDYLWGYPEPFIKLANTAVPGLFYYDSSGIMERLYDVGVNYRIELGTHDVDKFKVKKVKKFREKKNNLKDLIEKVQTFSDAYEGAAFPPGMTPETPVFIYRHSVCKVFKMQLIGSKKTEYGSEAFVYDLANETMNEHQVCFNDGWCPDGLVNLGPCYYNFPFALSKGHFLDADPKILERLEGLKADKKVHSSELVIDPKLGVTLTSSVSIQLNLALGDIGFNAETKRFKNTVVPLCHAKLRHPKLPWLAITAFNVMYVYGPYIVLGTTILSILLGVGLLVHSTKLLYIKWMSVRSLDVESTRFKNMTSHFLPLMKNNRNSHSR